MNDPRLILLCSVLIGMAIQPALWAIAAKLYPLFITHTEGWIHQDRPMSPITQSRIRGYQSLARLYGKSEARKEMTKLLPPHHKDARKYTIIVGWLPPLDLELKLDSLQAAQQMCEELKKDFPNNNFMPMWEKKAQKKYDIMGNINWNLNNIKELMRYEDTVGSEWLRREEKRA